MFDVQTFLFDSILMISVIIFYEEERNLFSVLKLGGVYNDY